MRGKVYRGNSIFLIARITPAYAGKRKQIPTEPDEEEDHPRVCGEKCYQHLQAAVARGSPPRMRGKEHVIGPYSAYARITPAYAGKSADGKASAGRP